MIPATLIALLATAAPAEPTSQRVLLKAAAAAAPSCRATRVDDQLVRVALFSPESEACPVAKVGDDVILLRELAQALELGHLQRSPRAAAPATRPDMDFTPALDRLIATRLLIQEAREMRIDADPKFRAAVDDFKASRLRAMLQREAVRGVKPDPAEVERLYREAVREWKIKSILLDKEDAAKAFQAALKAGERFDALAKKFVDGKKAKGGGPAEFVPPKQLLPEIKEALRGAKRGVPVGPIRIASGWVMLRVDGVRYPRGDAAAREQARAQATARQEREAVRRFYLSLVARYAKVDEPLLKRLDLEANGEKGFKALLEDRRPLATVRGEKPLTVGDLAREVSMKFFHGLESPIQQRRVNREKDDAFERLLGARLFAKEASARRLDARPELRRPVEEYERGLAFDTFVERVIAPDVKVTEQDAQRYYEQHKDEFTAPQMYKLDGLAFRTLPEAQAALDKLKAGTDFAWMQSSAPGQVEPEKRTLQLDGRTLSASRLPHALAQALAGVRSGEYRLYAPSGAEAWVVRVVDQTPPAAQPYVDAREHIAKRLWNERLAVAMNDYAGKLRKAQPVEVLVTGVSP
ncbi:peptidyl-prolyl cis-trans isomerase [Anaeromyxobacter oryzisoli]|uniref:peptidyl-prolyl cis-trans isomerase n=1 Tax=Anaeromyxobacter oryzisoli TaxID=2925408 RepID=UPI001F599A51|nr:peptidyl-prolyl cis-trans isomerase [Anaeromyxobacter sp. SG63]